MVDRSFRGTGAVWRKSAHSAESSDCVEIAAVRALILVRDSKDASGPVLTLDRPHWRGLLCGIRDSRSEPFS
ncbi:DUF397 domain-containing protein [Actinomadura kijaniata]|uniref:DUF397 domain-containing protein n=1 Tax=Actinomadura namibiensis TaxID=182080 RepID=A0A7W3QJZ7_ACTNM|nr:MULTISPECIES: DUF397 domain-containing protein [Actinomadura]MBA8949915.1 hypothetical protein [Actinomadura namibiensis]